MATSGEAGGNLCTNVSGSGQGSVVSGLVGGL